MLRDVAVLCKRAGVLRLQLFAFDGLAATRIRALENWNELGSDTTVLAGRSGPVEEQEFRITLTTQGIVFVRSSLEKCF